MSSKISLSILQGPPRVFKPRLLHNIFHEIALGDAAQATAIIYEGAGKKRKTSYAELENISNRFSRVIRKTVTEKQLKANSDGDFIIAVSMHPTDKLVIALLAIWKAGAAYLPLDPDFPGARMKQILNEAKPLMVICDEVSKFFSGTLAITYDTLQRNSVDMEFIPLPDEECLHHKRDDLAIVFYTSGSTGTPKGVRAPHSAILNRLEWEFNRFPYSNTERIVAFKTVLNYTDSAIEIWGPLLKGLSVLVIPKAITLNPEKFVNTLNKHKIERIILVPSLLKSMLLYLKMQIKKKYLNNLRILVSTGEPLTVTLAREFFEYFSDNTHILCNFYGTTEVIGDVTFYVIYGFDQLKTKEKVPIGRPLDNTVIYLLDGEMRPVQKGQVGELYASCFKLTSGYVNGRDPDKYFDNHLSFDPNFPRLYRTGDFAKIENGELIYLGRTDSQVKIRGHRVDLSEVEKCVHSLDCVENGVVLCYKPGEVDQALVSFVTTNNLVNEKQIESILNNMLISYMVPQVIILDNIPLLINGKTDRQALLNYYESIYDGETHVHADIDYTGVSSDQMEAAKVLFETLASVLHRSARSAICKEANFYEIGGNSLNSIFTITLLKEKGFFIGITDFIAAANFGEVLQGMSPDKEISTTNLKKIQYTAETLGDEHKEVAFDMIATSFVEKGDLEKFIPNLTIKDYTNILEEMWEQFVELGLSFIVRAANGKYVGVCMNCDARDEPKIEIQTKVIVIEHFINQLEGPVKDSQLPTGPGVIFYPYMMGTNCILNAKENISVTMFMEEEVQRVARKHRFAGIFATNTNPLTIQLGKDVYGYQTMLEYQVNKYVAPDKSKPFERAPDSQTVCLSWKPLNY